MPKAPKSGRTNEARWIESRQRWQINVQQDGERHTFTSSTPGTKGKIAAEQQADEWLKSNIRRKNMRFGELWELFLQDVQRNTGTANYRKHEQMGRLWILPRIRAKRLPAITRQDYQNCVYDAYHAGLSRKSCQNVRGTLTAVYRFARFNNWALERPEELRIPEDAPRGEKNILQPDDLNTLFSVDYINHYDKEVKSFYIYAWRFIVLTGLRRGELCGLKNDDIDGDVIRIRRSVNEEGEETKGKNRNARRYFVLSEHAKAVLEQQRAMLKERGIISPWIFPNQTGKCTNPNHIYNSWYVYRRQHGINVSLHEMRHTMISIAKADVPEELLKRAVGHSKTMDTFGIYGHDVEGEMERVANILDGIFDKLIK